MIKTITMMMGLILIGLWGSVLFIGGRIGAYAWWGVIGYSVIGGIMLMGMFVNVLIRLVKKKKIHAIQIIVIGISLLTAYPLTWFLLRKPIAYPSDVNKASPAVVVDSPLKGKILVAWGGDDIQHNYHAWLSCERWAYDLVMAPTLIDSDDLDAYGIYGQALYAPVDGVVVGVYDQEQDIVPHATEFLSALGNYIFIQIDETGTYLVMSHLKPNSALVNVGQSVKTGEQIGLIGNTGSTTEPHLHIHHQRENPNEILLFAEGLPLYFRDYSSEKMPLGGLETNKEGKDILVGDHFFGN
ncbi:M23 family metallopeptidase [Fusibacter sp. Q10-2]|uniref:M23 family metallopeptidase n=2 Tax=Fusibacter ferrireducens TaxID=2785058 RepID=A0ABR9ZPY4_9FIRM|nr:M23 family metallopeptidase [Fusibacter ferrireducens]